MGAATVEPPTTKLRLLDFGADPRHLSSQPRRGAPADELAAAINRAHAAGASFELIGRLLGVSRQRVAQLAERR